MITKTSANQKLQSGRKLLLLTEIYRIKFPSFYFKLNSQDLYNNDYHIYGAKNVTPEILETNTTAGRQLLQSIGREFQAFIAR